MLNKNFEMERKIAKTKATIIKELNWAYKELKKNGDYESYGRRIKGIYLSYAICESETSYKAMRDVLAGAAKDQLNEEILRGNYGLKVQVYSAVSDDIKVIKDLIKRYGKRVAETYIKGLNECQQYAICMSCEDQKKIQQEFESLVDSLSNVV